MMSAQKPDHHSTPNQENAIWCGKIEENPTANQENTICCGIRLIPAYLLAKCKIHVLNVDLTFFTQLIDI